MFLSNFLLVSLCLFGQVLGDVNNDNIVNIVDGLSIAQYSAGITPKIFYANVADVNCSGKVDITDALCVAMRAANTIASFPCQWTEPETVLPKVGAVQVDFYNGELTPITSKLVLNFKVTNMWTKGLALKDIRLRYYLTTEGNTNLAFEFLKSNLALASLTGLFEVQKNAPEHVCLEVGFKDNTGWLLPGKSATITVALTAPGGALFNQINDNSFNATATDYMPWVNVLGYYLDKCHWGYDVIRTTASLETVIPGQLYTLNCYGNFGLADF